MRIEDQPRTGAGEARAACRAPWGARETRGRAGQCRPAPDVLCSPPFAVFPSDCSSLPNTFDTLLSQPLCSHWTRVSTGQGVSSGLYTGESLTSRTVLGMGGTGNADLLERGPW